MRFGASPKFCKTRQLHHPNLTLPKRGGGSLNVKPRKAPLIKRWRSGGKHQLPLGKGCSGCPGASDYTSSLCFLAEVSSMKKDRKELC